MNLQTGPVSEVMYSNTFVKSRDGEVVLEELCKLFYDRPSYTKGDDAMFTAYKEGQRAVVAFILRKSSLTLEGDTSDAE